MLIFAKNHYTMPRKKGKKKGSPVNLSIADDIQVIGYKMARADRLTGLTALVERLLIQEAKRRGLTIKPE